MATIIAKRIDAQYCTSRTRLARLARYISNPIASPIIEPATPSPHILANYIKASSKQENGEHLQKCVELRCYNFSDNSYPDDPENTTGIEEKIREMSALCLDVDPNDKHHLIQHWVISFKGDDIPDNDTIFNCALDLKRELGFTDDHQTIVGIHKDTDNTHCHMMICRAGMLTGKIQQRKWNDFKFAQACLARSAAKYGLELEEKTKFRPTGKTETVYVKNPVLGHSEAIQVPEVKAYKPRKSEKPTLRTGARRHEMKTGLSSTQRSLQETLPEVFAQFSDEMWKNARWGDLHAQLARYGIIMKRANYSRHGLVFSNNNKTWVKGASLGPDFTFDAIQQRLGGKDWHPVRAETLQTALLVQKSMMPAHSPLGKMPEREKTPQGERGPRSTPVSLLPDSWTDSQRLTHRLTSEFLAKYKPDNLLAYRWGNIHKMLAEQGILMRLVKDGLEFSADNKEWLSCQDINPLFGQMALQRIAEKKDWRPVRDDTLKKGLDVQKLRIDEATQASRDDSLSFDRIIRDIASDLKPHHKWAFFNISLAEHGITSRLNASKTELEYSDDGLNWIPASYIGKEASFVSISEKLNDRTWRGPRKNALALAQKRREQNVNLNPVGFIHTRLEMAYSLYTFSPASSWQNLHAHYQKRGISMRAYVDEQGIPRLRYALNEWKISADETLLDNKHSYGSAKLKLGGQEWIKSKPEFEKQEEKRLELLPVADFDEISHLRQLRDRMTYIFSSMKKEDFARLNWSQMHAVFAEMGILTRRTAGPNGHMEYSLNDYEWISAKKIHKLCDFAPLSKMLGNGLWSQPEEKHIEKAQEVQLYGNDGEHNESVRPPRKPIDQEAQKLNRILEKRNQMRKAKVVAAVVAYRRMREQAMEEDEEISIKLSL